MSVSPDRPPFILSNVTKQPILPRTGGGSVSARSHGAESAAHSSATEQLLGIKRRAAAPKDPLSGPLWKSPVPACATAREAPLPPVEHKFAVCPTPESRAFFAVKKTAPPPPDPAHLRFKPAIVLPQHSGETARADAAFWTTAAAREMLLQKPKTLLATKRDQTFCGNATPRQNVGIVNQPAFSSTKVVVPLVPAYLDDKDVEQKLATRGNLSAHLASIHHPTPTPSLLASGAATPRSAAGGAASALSSGRASNLTTATVGNSSRRSGRRGGGSSRNAAVVVASSVPPDETEYVFREEEDIVAVSTALTQFERVVLPPVLELQQARARDLGRRDTLNEESLRLDDGTMTAESRADFGFAGEMMRSGQYHTTGAEGDAGAKSGGYTAGPISPDETATARVARAAFAAQNCRNLEVVKHLREHVTADELESRLIAEFAHRRQISKEELYNFLSRLLVRAVNKKINDAGSNGSDEASGSGGATNNNSISSGGGFTSGWMPLADDAVAPAQQQQTQQQQLVAPKYPYVVSRREVDYLFALLDVNRSAVVETKELRSQLVKLVMQQQAGGDSGGGASAEQAVADLTAFAWIASLLEGKDVTANAFVSRFDLQQIAAAVARRFASDPSPAVQQAVAAVKRLPEQFAFSGTHHLSRVPVAQVRDRLLEDATLLSVMQAVALESRKIKNGGSDLNTNQQAQLARTMAASMLGHFASPSIPAHVRQQQQMQQQMLLAATAHPNGGNGGGGSSSASFSILHMGNDSIVMQETLASANASAVFDAQNLLQPQQQQAVALRHDVMGVRMNNVQGGAQALSPMLVPTQQQQQQQRDGNGGKSAALRRRFSDSAILGTKQSSFNEDQPQNNSSTAAAAAQQKRRSPEQNSVSIVPPNDAKSGGGGKNTSSSNIKRVRSFAEGSNVSSTSSAGKKAQPTSPASEQKPRNEDYGVLSSVHVPIVSADRNLSEDEARQQSAQEHFCPTWYVEHGVLFRKDNRSTQARPVFAASPSTMAATTSRLPPMLPQR